MAFKIVLQEFVVEKIQKGRTSYEKGIATYTYNGANKTQTLVSFANPDVFKTLKASPPGSTLVVETTKNDAGYDQWSKVSAEGSEGPAKAVGASPATRVAGSNYETPEERKQRQLLIVRQSSLTNAISMLTPGAKAPLKSEEVIELAQDLVDFVYGVDEALEVDVTTSIPGA